MLWSHPSNLEDALRHEKLATYVRRLGFGPDGAHLQRSNRQARSAPRRVRQVRTPRKGSEPSKAHGGDPHSAVFRDIRNHLAGNTTGITRDQQLAVEITAILFCKVYDELNSEPNDVPQFRAPHKEPPERVGKRIKELFEKVKDEYPDVCRSHEEISLDLDSIRYVVGELQNYCLIEASRDAIGDAFEVFIGPAPLR